MSLGPFSEVPSRSKFSPVLELNHLIMAKICYLALVLLYQSLYLAH